jgi:hypothetical protein
LRDLGNIQGNPRRAPSMGELTRAERLRGRAMVDQEWAAAEDWYRATTPAAFARLMGRVERGCQGDPRAAVQAMTERDARTVLSGFALLAADLALRAEEADADTG